MAQHNENYKKVNNKKRMTKRMRNLILQLSLIGLISIIYLIVGMTTITKNYSKIANEIYLDVESMTALNQSLCQHQTLVFEHILASSPEKKAMFENSANELELEMRQLLEEFGNVMIGSDYETYYHNIYSGIVGYLKNVDIIFDFSNNNEIETAQYYMENILEDYLDSVNNTVETMDNLTKQDMNTAKEEMDKESNFVRISSTILLVVLLGFSAMAQVIGYRVSDEMVNVDAVTGIDNYGHFLENLQKREKKGSLVGYALLAINIKGFQYINQQVGTENGDQVLRKYARLLQNKLEKNDVIARASGDGFTMLLQEEKLEEFLDFLLHINIEVELGSQMNTYDEVRKITVSVPSRCGYYLIEKDITVEEAVEKATLALKMTRSTAESDQIKYSQQMSESEISRTQTIHQFKAAIEQKEFLVYYQPKVNLMENKLCGAEALVRWIHNDKIIPPLQFVPILEQEGYVIDLDFYVFEHVCQEIKVWQERGLKPVRISSNFSKLHLKDKNFANQILEIVEKYNVDTKYLEIELTESVGYEDYRALSDFIRKMKKQKIHISIDDFGTGYSSLSMMKTIEVDTVKLDKTFIDGIAGEKHNLEEERLITNIVRMITDLHREVICEGVETLEQVEFLKRIECYHVQGYFFDRPLPIEEFESRLSRPNY